MVYSRSFPVKNKREGTLRLRALGARRKGFDAQAARTGLARETWALQETPMGSLMLVWFEAPDVEKAFTRSSPPPATSSPSGSVTKSRM